MYDVLERLHQYGTLDELDVEFARFIAELSGCADPDVLLAAALVSRAVANGDVCLDLSQPLPLRGPDGPVPLPKLSLWRRALHACTAVGGPEQFKPLVLDEADRLYLRRYWDYESQLAEDLQRRAQHSFWVDKTRLAEGLARLFPVSPVRPDRQKLAAALAVQQGLAVISGGPGTGKTTTLAKVLALLIEQAARPLRIRVAAPTGKAAARLQEALRKSKQDLQTLAVPDAILHAIPEDASTLHRLLSPRPDGVYFRHDRDNPLALDVLVIDEASMVDLALMTKTVWALPHDARLILLGDKDQLSSVEAGAVLGEVCAAAGRYTPVFAEDLSALTGEPVESDASFRHPLQDAIALLSHSYRFGSSSGIGRLAGAVNRAEHSEIVALLSDPPPDVRWHDPTADPATDLLARMQRGYADYLARVQSYQDIREVFAAFAEFQVLCPQRSGETGVELLNLRFENALRQHLRRQSEWYPGRAVMITRNDYALRLFNGDIGVVLPDQTTPEVLRAWFQEADGTLRSVALSRLPAHEPAFALTIHKSQGSEFNRVLIVLPPDDTPGLTRELIYTGITRAKTAVELWGKRMLLGRAVERTVRRASGLRDKLAAG